MRKAFVNHGAFCADANEKQSNPQFTSPASTDPDGEQASGSVDAVANDTINDQKSQNQLGGNDDANSDHIQTSSAPASSALTSQDHYYNFMCKALEKCDGDQTVRLAKCASEVKNNEINASVEIKKRKYIYLTLIAILFSVVIIIAISNPITVPIIAASFDKVFTLFQALSKM